MMDSQGIHPGVEKGRRIFPKVNTCANSSLAKRLSRALAGIEKHLEANPNDSASKQRVSAIKSQLANL
jgi:ribosomal protein S15P/S13E